MSSGPARYEVSGERRNPKPSCRTSSVPSPKIASPFFAWCLRRAKTSSCLRRRFAPSSSLAIAMSTSSDTCLSLRSDKYIPGDLPGGWVTGLEDVTGRQSEESWGSAWLRRDCRGTQEDCSSEQPGRPQGSGFKYCCQ